MFVKVFLFFLRWCQTGYKIILYWVPYRTVPWNTYEFSRRNETKNSKSCVVNQAQRRTTPSICNYFMGRYGTVRYRNKVRNNFKYFFEICHNMVPDGVVYYGQLYGQELAPLSVGRLDP